ncbi:MAG: alpha/beta fold hydrolase [Deltaproteobacteria bacterium]|nr:alpha/beta fold hydrolase [Deltaproteobacteria bacterium]
MRTIKRNDKLSYTFMQLYSRIIGSGPPILILHGVFGMSDNWVTIGSALAEQGFSVHLLDLRNHGRSPHAETHRYPDMCDDLNHYLEQKKLGIVDIIGHSMGGKLAMMFGLLDPEKIRKLVIVDIAPSDYRDLDNSFHANIITTLLQIDLAAHDGRGSIKEELAAKLNDQSLATFLTKNIGRDERSEKFIWKLNLPVLQKFLQHLHIGLEELEIYAPCPVPTLFIKGNDSSYYLPEHEPDRRNFFPDSEVVGIASAGHWLHSEYPEKFLEIVVPFFNK